MKEETAIFGAGCFWCIEAIFQQLKGVKSVVPGYTGGHTSTPNYKDVCTGSTGHAEVAKIIFDPNIISYNTLLTVFWTTHDPTTLNRQGNDIGTQYRSAIFTLNDEQEKTATVSKKQVAPQMYSNKIVTEITPLETFHIAEDNHLNFYINNPNQGYCNAIIDPKVQKFRKSFKSLLKD